MSKKRILMVRHGRTEWNEQSRFQGGTDVPLDDEGRAQAGLLAARLKGWNPGAVFSSPLMRAWETARAIASEHENLQPVKLAGLSEMCFGVWEGRVIRDIIAAEGDSFTRWRESPFEYPPRGGETYESVAARVRPAMEAVMTADADRSVVVSHGGIIRAALALFLDIPPSVTWRMKITNCSVTAIDIDKRGVSLAFLNDDIHTALSAEEARGLIFSV